MPDTCIVQPRRQYKRAYNAKHNSNHHSMVQHISLWQQYFTNNTEVGLERSFLIMQTLILIQPHHLLLQTELLLLIEISDRIYLCSL